MSLESVPVIQPWYLYIIECRDTTLYTGITTNIEKRFQEHCNQGPRCAKYLRGKAPLKLVFHRQVGSRSDALKMEHTIKGLSAVEKRALIHSTANELSATVNV